MRHLFIGINRVFRPLVVAGLALLLVVLAACGENTATPLSSPATTPPTTQAVTTAAPTTAAPTATPTTPAATTTTATPTINPLATVTPMPVTTAAPTTAVPMTAAATTPPATTPPATTPPPATTEATGRQTNVQVFFSNLGRSENDVFPVRRTTNRPDVATFSLEQYIAGPTAQEKEQGFKTEISFSTPSNCGGKDFNLTITNGVANLKFCRSVPTGGVLQDARLTKALTANLKQFPTVSGVIILDERGNCFKDQSGLNNCLKPNPGQTEAERAVAERANQAVQALKQQDLNKLAALAHPDKGIRFTPYAFVSPKDIVFKSEQIKALAADKKVYTWGIYDGKGDPINLAWNDYYKRFVYRYDWAAAKQVSFNQTLGTGNTINNAKEFYPNSVIAEYYYPGFDPKYEGFDWGSLRLVFEKKADNWFLSGVINDEWTI